jgi:hypothetical protein
MKGETAGSRFSVLEKGGGCVATPFFVLQNSGNIDAPILISKLHLKIVYILQATGL